MKPLWWPRKKLVFLESVFVDRLTPAFAKNNPAASRSHRIVVLCSNLVVVDGDVAPMHGQVEAVSVGDLTEGQRIKEGEDGMAHTVTLTTNASRVKEKRPALKAIRAYQNTGVARGFLLRQGNCKTRPRVRRLHFPYPCEK